MNKRQRIADSDMRYLGKAWRMGFSGPRERPNASNIWQQLIQQTIPVRFIVDEEKVNRLHARWVVVGKQDRRLAAVLKLYYRDGYEFDDKEVMRALDAFSLT